MQRHVLCEVLWEKQVQGPTQRTRSFFSKRGGRNGESALSAFPGTQGS